jgi:hypothetical protein
MAYPLDEAFDRCMGPLPRDHDAPFPFKRTPEELIIEQKQQRQKKIDHISNELAGYFAESMLNLIEKQDSHNGYENCDCRVCRLPRNA